MSTRNQTSNGSLSISAGVETTQSGRSFARRDVFKALGLGAVTLIVAGTGVLVTEAASGRILNYNAGPAYDPWRDWNDNPGPLGLVAAAILAANPHNTQPWIFKISATHIDLWSDPSRAPPVTRSIRSRADDRARCSA